MHTQFCSSKQLSLLIENYPFIPSLKKSPLRNPRSSQFLYNIAYKSKMSFCRNIDKSQLMNLLTGMAGIYICYFIGGLLHESLLKKPYLNRNTNQYQICDYPFGMNLIPIMVAWIVGRIYIKRMIPDRVRIPIKNAAITGFTAASAPLFSIIAIRYTSFPVVTMMQSCSILPVVFVAIFCTRVTDKKLKLGFGKLVTAGLITTGIFIFQIFDEQNKKNEKKDELLGLLFVLLFFIADGFLPDLQAEIKVKYKPQPIQMMSAVNFWGCVFMIFLLTVTWHLPGFLRFMAQHPLFSVELFGMSLVSAVGQFFVYRMIKQFKQHFVPFTITSRKILTVGLSLFWYGHKTNFFQMFGLVLVLGTVVVEFFIQISKPMEATSKINEERYELNEEAPAEMDPQPVQMINDNGQQENSSPVNPYQNHHNIYTNQQNYEQNQQLQDGIASKTPEATPTDHQQPE